MSSWSWTRALSPRWVGEIVADAASLAAAVVVGSGRRRQQPLDLCERLGAGRRDRERDAALDGELAQVALLLGGRMERRVLWWVGGDRSWPLVGAPWRGRQALVRQDSRSDAQRRACLPRARRAWLSDRSVSPSTRPPRSRSAFDLGGSRLRRPVVDGVLDALGDRVDQCAARLDRLELSRLGPGREVGDREAGGVEAERSAHGEGTDSTTSSSSA